MGGAVGLGMGGKQENFCPRAILTSLEGGVQVWRGAGVAGQGQGVGWGQGERL